MRTWVVVLSLLDVTHVGPFDTVEAANDWIASARADNPAFDYWPMTDAERAANIAKFGECCTQYVGLGETEGKLCTEYALWCAEQNLPAMSADELIHETITPEQRAYLSSFIDRWEAMLEAQDV